MFYKYLEKFNVSSDGSSEIAERDKYINQWREHIKNINMMPNLIITGSQGVGKYYFALSLLYSLSPSNLRIHKKIHVDSKITYTILASDIHYEVDFAQMTINAKTIWIDIYKSIMDINSISNKTCVIMCKNIHSMNEELLDIFYYLMPKTDKIKWMFISEHVDFIPTEIINICERVSLRRPTKQFYLNLREKIQEGTTTPHARMETYDKITNIYMLYDTIPLDMLEKIFYVKEHPEHILENEIVHVHNTKITTSLKHTNIANILASIIIEKKKINIIEIREYLYHILTYHIPIEEIMMYVYDEIVKKMKVEIGQMKKICQLNVEMLDLYKNNYRPIYHLEKWFYSVLEILYKDNTK
jgi:hypothetical protein